jgi:carbon starvation protein CstA
MRARRQAFYRESILNCSSLLLSLSRKANRLGPQNSPVAICPTSDYHRAAQEFFWMRFNYWYLAAALPLTLLMTRAEYGAQLAVLTLALGIFFGTLSLKRSPTPDATTTHPGV